MVISDKWLTLDELAEYLKIGRTNLYAMAQNATIPATKIGNQWRFDREKIDRWMDHKSNYKTRSYK
ncbi:MAG: helix-turn-helix domain-containing protein [Phycisphaerae bacterium]|nr:helix-turn-helix domain-containing protein [Phycisphaerae bacterium]